VVLLGLVGIVHVSAHAVARPVFQTYSPEAFRRCTLALGPMTHVIQLAGGISTRSLAS